MNKKTKGIIIVLVLIIIAIAIYLIYTYSKNDDAEVSNVTNNIVVENNTMESDIIENDVAENSIEKEEEEHIDEGNEEQTVEENQNTPSEGQESSNDNSELVSANDEDKAIQIAKKAWGSTDDVYFSIEQIASNGDYIVRVTSNATVLAWITVNVGTEEYNVEYN